MLEQFKFVEIVDVSQNFSKKLLATNFKDLNLMLENEKLNNGIYVIKLFINPTKYYAIDLVVEV